MANLTLSTKTKLKGNPTLGELMDKELSGYNLDFSKVGPNVHKLHPESIPKNVQLNTTREFKEKQVEFLAEVYRIYGSPWVTRQMVVAVNLFRGQSSCPNYLNKNAECLTSVRGLYHLPEWAFPKNLVKEVRNNLSKAAKELKAKLKEQAKLAKAEDKAKIEAQTSDEKAIASAKGAPAKTTKKAAAKKTSKKVKTAKPEQVEPAAAEPAEEVQQILAPPTSDEQPADNSHESSEEETEKVESKEQ